MVIPSFLAYLPLCLVLVVSTVATGQQCKQMQAKKEHLNKRLTGHLLKAATIPSYGTCAYHCLVSTDCQSINYCLGPSLCELNTDDSQAFPAHLVQANNCVFTDKGDLPKSMARECEVNSCPASHNCIPGLQQGCQKLCQSPPEVTNAVVSAQSSDEGSEAVYECVPGYTPVPPSSGAMVMTATCMSTGTWSSTNVMCVGVCPSPPHVANAVVSVGSLLEGSQSVYECVPGYRAASMSMDAVVVETTCSPTGTWTPTNFMCAHRSCKQIKAASPSAPSEQYPVFPGAATKPLVVFCDFEDPLIGYTYLPKSSLSKLQGLEDIADKTDHVMLKILYDSNEQYAVKMAQHSSFTQYPLSFQLSKHDDYNGPLLGSDTPYIFIGFLPEAVASVGSYTQGYHSGGTNKEFVNCDGNGNSCFAFFANPINLSVYSGNCGSCNAGFTQGWLNEAQHLYQAENLPAANDDYFYFFEMRFGGCGGLLTSQDVQAVGVAAGLPFEYP